MTILVTGGTGFIGTNLIKKLLGLGFEVRCYSRGNKKPVIKHERISYFFADINDRNSLSSALNGVDYVFHLACSMGPHVSNSRILIDIDENLKFSIILLEECVKSKIKKIIFASSGGTIYGIPEFLPIGESDKCNPITSYGILKLVFEKYLKLFNYLHGLNYCSLRISNPYGQGHDLTSGQGIIPIFIKKLIKNEPISIFGNGEITRDYIYIDDLVEVMIRAIVVNTEHSVFNIGYGKGYTINEVIEEIENVSKLKFKINFLESRKSDIPKIILNIDLATQEFQWAPQTTLSEGILNTFKMSSNKFWDI